MSNSARFPHHSMVVQNTRLHLWYNWLMALAASGSFTTDTKHHFLLLRFLWIFVLHTQLVETSIPVLLTMLIKTYLVYQTNSDIINSRCSCPLHKQHTFRGIGIGVQRAQTNPSFKLWLENGTHNMLWSFRDNEVFKIH